MRFVIRHAAATFGSLAALSLVVPPSASAQKPVRSSHRPGAGTASFSLLEAAHAVLLERNRVICGLTSSGQICEAVAAAPNLGGANWPRGTPDQYIFRTGLQVGAIIPANAGFPWAGDTVGAWAIDTRGSSQHMTEVTGIWNSLASDDLESWPVGAYVTDPAAYHPALLGRKTASHQDTWVRYWDGDPDLVTGRVHTMGLLVEQRTLAWDHPGGPEDIVFVVFRLTNVTARTASVYDGLAAEGRSPADIAAIAAVGAEFQRLSEAEFNVAIPDDGYAFQAAYVAFTADMDVGDAGNNYATAVLPFRLGVTWKTDWREPSWLFPRTIFTEPFAVAPGLVGAKLLRTPDNAATGREADFATWSTYTGLSSANSMPDPVNTFMGYRYFAHSSGPATGDLSCQYPPSRIVCFLAQAPSDQRFMQSAGPFDLAPGQSALYAIAYVFAPALVTNPGRPGFDLTPYIGNTSLLPGVPPLGDRLLQGLDTLRMIDAIMGWQGHADLDGDGFVEEHEVTTVPGSLLDKARVAQSIFDNRFLLPAAPEAPEFHLLPGDDQVTLVWTASATESAGDPYFAAASDPTSGLYDPNYRSNDVEGYRVWRGTSPSSLELLAQYDYAGTVMQDWTGTFVDDFAYRTANGAYLCAPELGIIASCPAFPHPVELAQSVIQVAPGGRLPLRDATGTVTDLMITRADTTVIGGASGFSSLTDTDVPFAYQDADVRNGYRYYYAVTAFDVNSYASGPSSQSSLMIVKSVVPRAPASNADVAQVVSGLYGDDTVALTAAGTWTPDSATGRFTGPPPPTNALTASFAPLVPALLPALSLTITVDSLVPHSGADFACGAAENVIGVCYEAFLTVERDGQRAPASVLYHPSMWSGLGGGDVRFTYGLPITAAAVPADSGSSARHGIPSGTVRFDAIVSADFEEYIRWSSMEGHQAWRAGFGFPNLGGGGGVSPGGSRWFDGADETVDHPGAGIRVGHVTGADTVWAPLNNMDTDPGTAGNQTYAQSTAMRCLPYALGGLGRQADVRLTWGAGGQVASVRDVTHHVPVIFKPTPQASYGFVGDANADGVISFTDFDHTEVVAQLGAYAAIACGVTDPGPGNRHRLSAQPVIMDVSTDGSVITAPPVTGRGFGLYINGERYIVQLTGGTAPAAGTVWTLRTYAGMIRASAGAATYTPSGYSLITAIRPALIPGLRVVFRVDRATAYPDSARGLLAGVHTVPDPLYVTHLPADPSAAPELRFVGLPDRAIVRVYSTSGILVALLTHNDPTGGGALVWDLRSRNGDVVASGVYFYHVVAPSGETRVGRFTVVTSGR